LPSQQNHNAASQSSAITVSFLALDEPLPRPSSPPRLPLHNPSQLRF